MKNFGEIKNKFNDILIESIIKKDNDGKKTFGKFINMLKENVILKTQYRIFDNIENKYFDNSGDAKDYIKENLSLLSKYTRKEIKEANKKLASIISFKRGKEYENKELHENISKVIFTVKTPKTLDMILESINTLRDHMTTERVIVENKIERVDLPPSVLTKMVVNKFNSKYEDITEGEKNILKSILNGTEKDRETVYINIIRECIDTIDNRLVESDVDIKEKLLNAKDKLLRMEYNKETYNTDISRVYELKQSVETE